jgi:hypothetical protein
MRAPAMVILKIARQEAPEVALVDDHHLIQALVWRMLPIMRFATAFYRRLRGVVRTCSMPNSPLIYSFCEKYHANFLKNVGVILPIRG